MLQSIIDFVMSCPPKNPQDQNIFQREREELAEQREVVEEEAKELKAEILKYFGFKTTVIRLMVQKSCNHQLRVCSLSPLFTGFQKHPNGGWPWDFFHQ